jgi:hypothetical protein
MAAAHLGAIGLLGAGHMSSFEIGVAES